jgi:hypothetical protein
MIVDHVFAQYPEASHFVVGKNLTSGRSYLISKSRLQECYTKGVTPTGLTLSTKRFQDLKFVPPEVYLLLN